MRLKIYSDESFLLKYDGILPHPMLYPFWPHLVQNSPENRANKYARYTKIANELFEMTPLDEADLAIMPDDWRTVVGEVWYADRNLDAETLYLGFASKVSRAEKPLVVFFGSDLSDREVDLENSYIFRHSCYASKQKNNDFSWPTFCEDLIDQYSRGELQIRKKKENPVVGFCGLIKQNSLKNKAKEIAFYSHSLVKHRRFFYPPVKGHTLRSKVLDSLTQNPEIETNFIIREKMVFLGQKIEDSNAQKLSDVRLEFVQNLLESDYIVCCRGAGNFSNRIFETLCCGRIPIVIDTDCVLPYDFAINWKDFCVWVDESEISEVADKVLEFHQKMSNEDFERLQRKCRSVWEEWLSPEGFYSNFYLHFTRNRA